MTGLSQRHWDRAPSPLVGEGWGGGSTRAVSPKFILEFLRFAVELPDTVALQATRLDATVLMQSSLFFRCRNERYHLRQDHKSHEQAN
jgi:hypothetical protein